MRWLCRFWIHAWSNWRSEAVIYNGGLLAGFRRYNGYAQFRTCSRCGKEQVRQL